MKPASEYIELIDRNFKLYKRLGKSRMDIGWGKWSRDMNKEVRYHPYQSEIYAYWMKKSQLLELYFRNYFFCKIWLKRKIKKECKEIAKLFV